MIKIKFNQKLKILCDSYNIYHYLVCPSQLYHYVYIKREGKPITSLEFLSIGRSQSKEPKENHYVNLIVIMYKSVKFYLLVGEFQLLDYNKFMQQPQQMNNRR